MELTYTVWIGLCVLGILSGIYIIIKDKRDGKVTKAKRELQASVFFAIVMFCTLAVSFFEAGVTFISFISFLFFVLGLFMIILNFKKYHKENNSY